MRAYIMLAALASVLVSSIGRAAGPSSPSTQPSPDPDLANPAMTYHLCLDLAREQPDKAIELAGKWVGLGGGEGAKHCQALALIGLKEYGEGATRLEALARQSRQEPLVRANMLAQAGQAWMLQGETSRAYAAQSAALKILPEGSPQKAEILLDRAGALADAGKYDEVLLDIDAALKIFPNSADALAFRASANRSKGDIDDALKDAERAVASDDTNLAALLERGNLYRMKKRLADARKDWLRILELEPQSAAADSARTNIERIDVDTRAN
ncbi:MAG: tetratricopeptide repeat protein [Rhodospirillaceae bacterium]|nr:tetratricopeptide repeat protein [Rhodospirillaceae bacterium]